MIKYFTGTGNSKWAANEAAFMLGDKATSIFETSDFDDDILGIAFPIYAWGLPKPMRDYLSTIDASKYKYVYMIATCGSNCGYVDSQIENIIGRELDAKVSLSLPNNYIQGGDCDDDSTAKNKFSESSALMREFSGKVAKREKGVNMLTRGPLPHLLTTVVHPLFNIGMNSSKSYTVTDACMSCGKCAKDCPTSNINIVDGKPVFGMNCCNCTACINNCSKNAIKYGKHDRRTYHFKEEYVK